MFNELTISYLFLGGTGAGAVFFLAFLEIANLGRFGIMPGPVEKHTALGRPLRVLRKYFAVPHGLLLFGWVTSFFVLIAGCASLFFDLGHPERIWHLLITTSPTVVTWGAWALLTTAVCAGLFSVMALMDHSQFKPKVVFAWSMVSIICSFITMIYTGLLLLQFASVLAFQTWLIPGLFLLSSLSCGIALLFGTSAFIDTRVLFSSTLMHLARIDRVIMICELMVLMVYLIWMVNDQSLELTVHEIFHGTLRAWLWGGVVIVGLIIPYVIERLLSPRSERIQYLFIAAFVLAGGAILRYFVTSLALFDPIMSADYFGSLVALGVTAG